MKPRHSRVCVWCWWKRKSEEWLSLIDRFFMRRCGMNYSNFCDGHSVVWTSMLQFCEKKKQTYIFQSMHCKLNPSMYSICRIGCTSVPVANCRWMRAAEVTLPPFIHNAERKLKQVSPFQPIPGTRYFDMCHWPLYLIGSCLHKYKLGREGWAWQQNNISPLESKNLPLIKDVIGSFVCFRMTDH